VKPTNNPDAVGKNTNTTSAARPEGREQASPLDPRAIAVQRTSGLDFHIG
jgi:hypothetical protein